MVGFGDMCVIAARCHYGGEIRRAPLVTDAIGKADRVDGHRRGRGPPSDGCPMAIIIHHHRAIVGSAYGGRATTMTHECHPLRPREWPATSLIEAMRMQNPLILRKPYEIRARHRGARAAIGLGKGSFAASGSCPTGRKICPVRWTVHETPPPGLLAAEPGATSRYVLNPGHQQRTRSAPAKTPYIDLDPNTVRCA